MHGKRPGGLNPGDRELTRSLPECQRVDRGDCIVHRVVIRMMLKFNGKLHIQAVEKTGAAFLGAFIWTALLLCYKVIIAERFDVKFGSQRAQTCRLPLRR